MTIRIIRYEDLTWPEVAQLPRDTPMVLPLGEGYAIEGIAGAIGANTLCLLPGLPYGWRESIVEVGTDLLRRVVGGIFSGPHDDGFTHLIVVHAGKEDLNMLGVHQARPAMTDSSPATLLAASPQRVIIIPAGHTEQHGYHLPMNTDSVIIDTIASNTAQSLPDQAEMLPVLPYGVSTHRSEFSGTFNLGGRVFEDFMLAVIENLVVRGADRFYFMSGHGGNHSFLVNVVKYAGERHPGIFAATTWLHTSGRIAAPVVTQYRRSGRGGMGHAGELETAYMLHLRPDLCRMDQVVDETDFITTTNYYMDWIEGGDLVANPPWSDDTKTGSYGAGSVATAENGERWLQAAIKEKTAHILEIHEQQELRIAKRIAATGHSLDG